MTGNTKSIINKMAKYVTLLKYLDGQVTIALICKSPGLQKLKTQRGTVNKV